jgi:hypothetical protein
MDVPTVKFSPNTPAWLEPITFIKSKHPIITSKGKQDQLRETLHKRKIKILCVQVKYSNRCSVKRISTVNGKRKVTDWLLSYHQKYSSDNFNFTGWHRRVSFVNSWKWYPFIYTESYRLISNSSFKIWHQPRAQWIKLSTPWWEYTGLARTNDVGKNKQMRLLCRISRSNWARRRRNCKAKLSLKPEQPQGVRRDELVPRTKGSRKLPDWPPS